MIVKRIACAVSAHFPIVAMCFVFFVHVEPLRAASLGTDRVMDILAKTPLIDGHNDWPDKLAKDAGDSRWVMDLRQLNPAAYNTDIARLRKGGIGGQFWSVFVSPDLRGPVQVERTLEQIDFVRQLAVRYPETFEMAITAADIRRIHKAGRIACMMGVEGGGQIDERFSVLRAYRQLGASYLTLTQAKTISWADSATDNPRHGGLTPFGVAVVHELNRLGMLVDISHVSEGTMRAAIAASAAPVIFSHSDARALSDHTRNVSDSILKLLAKNGGVVMVSFAPNYVSDEYRRWNADRAAEITRHNNPPFGGLYVGEPDRAAAALSAWDKEHPRPSVTLKQVADHIEHVAKIAGIDHVGIGSDLDGINGYIPDGLGSVEDYPALLAELIRRGWRDSDIAKLAGENVLRVMAEVEQVAIKKKMEPPAVATVAQLDGENGR